MKLLLIKIFLLCSILGVFTQSLPESFDFRQKWKHCSSPVIDQGKCGGCWTISVASALTSRYCIWGNEQERSNFVRWSGNQVSPQVSLSCQPDQSLGCKGGWPQAAWLFHQTAGSASCSQLCQKGCVPYSSKECANDDSHSGCNQCSNVRNGNCQNGERRITWRSAQSFQIEANPSYELAIMEEIYHHGPVVATYEVRENFGQFFKDNPDGIYSEAKGKKVGGHAVMVVGWGVENGVKYWLVQNSYGPNFGVKGFFKYIRGTNLLGFEENVSAGCPYNGGCFSRHRPLSMQSLMNSTSTMMKVGSWEETESETIREESVAMIVSDMSRKRQWLPSFNITVDRVVTQPVAGLNIKVEFTVNSNEESTKMEAHLFKSLEGKYEIEDIYEV